jgi:hypothetical protein
MMGILLTEIERRDICTCKEGTLEAVAKAQLRKVVDEAIKQHVINVKDGEVFGCESRWFWQSLLKECE